MTERPLLFNGWKVQAIGAGATQDRRPVKDMPPSPAYSLEWHDESPVYSPDGGAGWYWTDGHVTVGPIQSPFGVPGDSLIPLTTWSVHADLDQFKPTELPGEEPIWSYWSGDDPPPENGKRRPGRFLPLFLRCQLPRLLVKRVWVERVQSITDADVVAEGIEQLHIDKYREFFDARDVHGIAFGETWDSIYAEKHPWSLNPWDFGCEFEVTDKWA